MTTDQKYKHTLEEEKKMLIEQLSEHGTQDPKSQEWEVTTAAPDAAEVADANTSGDRFEDYEESSAVMVPLKARLAQVEAALGRIENGGYGACRVCRNPIEEARLEVNPAAETCMTHIEE
jgi:RNA polymerase-binding transcription factor DksA